MASSSATDNVPHKAHLLLASRVMSIFAFLCSLTFLLSYSLGFVAFIMYQITWCYRMNKIGIIVAGILASMVGIVNFLVAFVLVYDSMGYTDSASYRLLDTFYYSKSNVFKFYLFNEYGPFSKNSRHWAIVSALGGALWIAVAVCSFVFVYKKQQHQQQQQQPERNQEETTPVEYSDHYYYATKQSTTADSLPSNSFPDESRMDIEEQQAIYANQKQLAVSKTGHDEDEC